MTKEKQIEEMAKLIMPSPHAFSCKRIAEALYNAGYRKQSEGATDTNVGNKSEWISVDERLPETDARVLVYMHENRMSYTRIDTDRVVKGEWVRWETCVTHWMPLPEPPKGE